MVTLPNVILIGGGIAGLWALRRLRGRAEVTLLDPRGACDFLPLLPDLVGRDYRPETLRFDLAEACRAAGATYRPEPAEELDLSGPAVRAAGGWLEADYVLLACGSRTGFFGRDDLAARAMTLDCVDDGVRIARAADESPDRAAVVVGGGYTGIEIATHLRRRDQRRGRDRRIVVVELMDTLLPRLPEDFQRYATRNVRRMGIETRTGRSVDRLDGADVLLSDGQRFADAMLIWSAGVRGQDVAASLDVERTKNGRLMVDEHLRIAPRVYVAGDAAAWCRNGQPIRMGIQFSISEGTTAAGNILRDAAEESLRTFRPFDPGYIVPMSNTRSCGVVLGSRTFGLTPTLLHYLLCCLRSFGWSNRLAVLADLLRSMRRV